MTIYGHDAPTGRYPTDEDLDLIGISETGKVRERNEDQYLLCTLHKQMRIRDTSLQTTDDLGLTSESIAFLAMVADGVGGHRAGEEASRMTVEHLAGYVTHSMRCYYTHDSADDEAFLSQLHEAVQQSHALVRSEATGSREGMASTLTLLMVIWPRAYVVQVGDSRAYLLRAGELIRLTKDQTIAQELYDKGLMSTGTLKRSPLRNVLSSAIGAKSATSVTTLADLEWDDVLMLCSDGLTDMVSEQVIASLLQEHPSAGDACRALVDRALDEGGRDNVTAVVGRMRPR
jgi:protein phosphatase